MSLVAGVQSAPKIDRSPVASSALPVTASEHQAQDVRVQDVRLVYANRGRRVEAISQLSLAIASGEFVSVVGPSGCGKSSLLRAILGLVRPTSGEIQIGGRRVTGPRRDVGIVFQSPVLLPWKTVLGNVMLPAHVARIPAAKARPRAFALIRNVGLEGFENYYPAQLSGGMQHRVAIVRSLLHDPSLLLMDEPFAALDALTREQISFDLQKLWMEQHKTIVFVTHSISEAVFLSNRIVVMSARPGRILEIFTNPQPQPRSDDDLAAPDFIKIVREIRKLLGPSGTEKR
jgi:NitT/TauT family transport system ATP-binding protein